MLQAVLERLRLDDGADLAGKARDDTSGVAKSLQSGAHSSAVIENHASTRRRLISRLQSALSAGAIHHSDDGSLSLSWLYENLRSIFEGHSQLDDSDDSDLEYQEDDDDDDDGDGDDDGDDGDDDSDDGDDGDGGDGDGGDDGGDDDDDDGDDDDDDGDNGATVNDDDDGDDNHIGYGDDVEDIVDDIDDCDGDNVAVVVHNYDRDGDLNDGDIVVIDGNNCDSEIIYS